jgi:TFIIF-interacting CTD phosphatase-like protein
MFKTWLETVQLEKPFVFLDLDETLIHCLDYPDAESIIARPHLEQFLKSANKFANLCILTRSPKKYADAIMHNLGLSEYFAHIFSSRDDNDICKKLNLDKQKWVLVDNRYADFPYTIEKMGQLGNNGELIKIKSWIGDKNDNRLMKIIPKIKKTLNIT